jgi:hypothetical protein
LLSVTQPLDGGENVREYLNTQDAAAVGGSVAVHVPSVVVVPFRVSVTVIFLFTVEVGARPVKSAPAWPVADPSGVDAALALHVTFTVFVPFSGDGAEA